VETWDVILVFLSIVIAHAGLSVFNIITKKKPVRHNNEVAGIIFGVITLIYSLIIAFVIVAVWENYEDLNKTIENEAADLNTVLVHSNLLPDSLERSVDLAIENYCQKVVTEEWGISENHVRFRESAIPSLRLLLFKAQVNGEIQPSLITVLDEKLTNITRFRQERLSHTRAYVPPLVWMSLTIGSILVVCFSYFFYMESMLLKRIFLSFLWGMMGMSLFLIYMLDHPFDGSGHVSKEPYELIIQLLSEK
jgi:hypothetical protein